MSTTMREEIKLGPIVVRPHIEGDESGGAVAIHEFEVAPNAGLPVAHSHDAYEETVYGLRGTITFTVEGTPIDVAPGDALCIRRGEVHLFDNNGDVPAAALAIITPGILGAGYFREIAALVDAAQGAPDPAAIAEVMLRHGLTPAR